MSMAADIGSYLETATSGTFTIGGTTGNLSLGQALDSQPDTLVTLYEQPGIVSEYAFSTGNPTGPVFERPNLQAISRSTSPITAKTRIDLVYTKLDGLHNTTINSVRYLDIQAAQAPFQLGRDENERHLWAVNFQVKREMP